MFSIRLSKEEEKKLYEISLSEGVSKAEIVKDALEDYFEDYYKKNSPYNTGRIYFGKYGSGSKDDSVNFKDKVKRKINEKMSY